MKRPVGRPPHEVRRYYASFRYQAGSWIKPRRVVAKVEWHLGELYPRVGFIVTNMTRPAVRLVMFYNQRGTAEQWIPLCQRSCRPDRIKTSGGAGRRTWLGMDRRLRTSRWRDCCRRRVVR